MYAPYGLFFGWTAERRPRNAAGGAIGLINSFGALGSFVGSYAVGWLDGATGIQKRLLMAGPLLVSGIITLVVGVEQVQAIEIRRLAPLPHLDAGGRS